MTSGSEILAIVEAYVEGRLSFNGVALQFDTTTARVRYIMEKHAPGSIRPRHHKFCRPPPNPDDLTLKNLGLYNVGPCADCETPMVSSTQKRGQACGFCQIARRAT